MSISRHTPSLVLVSHPLCPYVQRAAIVLAEKGVPFERREIDLANKPDWFLAISPLGKTPVLLAGNEPVFESAVICEYLEDLLEPRLHPSDLLERARHRSWIEYGSAILNSIARLYAAQDDAALTKTAAELHEMFTRLEQHLPQGPYFAGQAFSIVDAVYGPVFRYFDTFDSIADFGVFKRRPKVQAWRRALQARPSVNNAVAADYPQRLRSFLKARGSAISRQIT